MSRMKIFVAVLVLTVIASIVPQAHAALTVQVVIAGSSAQWQSLALGACTAAGAKCAHWTSASNVINLVDNRPATQNVDAGSVWVVWNCNTANCSPTSVWIFDKVDSVVGDRCFFAVPACIVSATSANLAGTGGNKIAGNLWPFSATTDQALPSSIVTLLTNGTNVTAAATDIRPEDAAFAVCRVNSAAGSGTVNTADGLDGLGYNTNNASGACPAAGAGHTSPTYVGSPILSGYPGKTSSDAANVLAFNITGNDPISGSAIAPWTVVNVGAAPIVFGIARQGALANLQNATPHQLSQVFSGNNCDASAFGAGFSGPINIFLREPLSGTMNTTEATVFRHPTVNATSGSATIDASQETGVYNTSTLTLANPLNGTNSNCVSGAGFRYRVIGTGESTAGIQNSNNSSVFTGTGYAAQDGIGYFFFSYGNASALADKSQYGYITLNGVDPIFSTYGSQISTGKPYDIGQPAVAGEFPGSTDLTACGNTFPCAENQIWTAGYSYPNVRNGFYPSWSLLRIVAATTGGSLTAVKTLVTDSQKNVVTEVPDYIPYAAVTITGTNPIKDPGLLVLRAHYQQKDGAGNLLGAGPVENFTKTGTGGFTEAGGDMGGEVFTCATQATCPNQAGVVATTAGAYTPQSQQVIGGFNNGGFQLRP